jgi:hypothetical protein
MFYDWEGRIRLAAWIAASALAAAYILAIALKRRIPTGMQAFVSDREDMSRPFRVELRRKMWRRNLWPFGREVCALGPLELYPHPKDRNLVVLSSIAVQYGLKIDGRPPQHHKARDRAGDYVIGPDNIVGVCERGSYRYYRIAAEPKARAEALYR